MAPRKSTTMLTLMFSIRKTFTKTRNTALIVASPIVSRLAYKSSQQTVVWVFSSYVLSALAATGLQIVQARFLTIAQLGYLTAALAISTIFEGIVTSRGADTALSLFAHNRKRGPRFLGRLLAELLITDFLWNAACVVLFVLFLAAAAQLMKVNLELLTMLAVATLLQFAWSSGKSAMIVLEPTRSMAQIELTCAVVTGVLGAVGTIYGGILGYAYGMIAAAGLRSLICIGVLRRRIPLMAWRVRRFRVAGWQKLRNLGALALMRSAASIVAGQLDILLLSASAPISMLAYYRVARSCAGVPGKVLAPIWTIARKSIVHGVTREDLRETRRTIAIVGALLMLMGLPVFVASAFFAKEILAFLFGQAYAQTDAANSFVLLMPALWFLTLATGWSRFVAIVAPRKGTTTFTYIAQCVVCAALWLIFWPTTALGMAAIIAGTNVITAAAFWVILFNDKWILSNKLDQKAS